MKKAILVIFLLILVLSASVFTTFALGPAPSWQLTAAPADVCTGDVIFIPGMTINAPSPASELGTLSAPGEPNLGFTQDTSFSGVGVFSFAVFTGSFSLPDNTLLTLSVNTYAGPNFTGGIVYNSTMTWNCTTGEIISLVNGVVGPGCPNPLMSGSVIGEAPLGAQIYWGPSANQASPGNLLNPGTYWVMGVDETGEYAKIWLTCQSVFWVRSDTLQPSYQPPQNGQALPTRVVN
jgi:hypothetical protein